MDKIVYKNLTLIKLKSNMNDIVLKDNIDVIHTKANSIMIMKRSNIIMYIPFNNIKYIHTTKLNDDNIPNEVLIKFWECR